MTTHALATTPSVSGMMSLLRPTSPLKVHLETIENLSSSLKDRTKSACLLGSCTALRILEDAIHSSVKFDTLVRNLIRTALHIREYSKVLQRIAKNTDMAHLAGMDAITLTKLILDAHTRAAEHSDACEDLFRRVKFVGNLLVELRVRDLNVSAIRKPLVDLEEALRRTYLLVAKNQEHNYAYKFALGWKINRKFKKALKEFDTIISIITLIFFVDYNRARQITNDKEIPLQEGYCGDKVDDGEVNQNVSGDDFKSPVDDGELNCNVSEEEVRERR
ncbi:unnamed protein product [Lactuca saligna]|uniref:MCAfunc domain-containing protein n=1 Tax=Lactuca saligna TaxID=75948 RepID=A0AA35YYH1_LACSI|nr:unnamed protein product [Lactuca saligna]